MIEDSSSGSFPVDRSYERRPVLVPVSRTFAYQISYQAEIGIIHIAGPIASAAIIEDNLLGVDYVNHFHLLKIDGRWRIVSKIYMDVP